ncbi:MAG: LysR substrate-binding domain-containing protein, partial [Pseudomonadota bacterium]
DGAILQAAVEGQGVALGRSLLVAPSSPRRGPDGAILQAAVEGQGVALGRSLLVADDIATGRLVAPFPVSLDASHAYWFVRPKGMTSTHGVEAVETWLVSQFET